MKEKINIKYNLPYKISNVKSDISIFMLHGLGDSLSSFNNQIDFFENKYKCVYFDLPGSGSNNQIYLSFEDTLNLIEDIFKAEQNKINVFIGHSMGGLLGLLTIVDRGIPVDLFFAIEASISSADKNFFNYIQEKPNGIGFDEFKNSLQDLDGYLPTYKLNVNNTNPLMFNEFSKNVLTNFDSNQTKILNSNFVFDYIIGEKSNGFEDRIKLQTFKNVNLHIFKNSEHWVHFDEYYKLNNLIELKIKSIVAEKTATANIGFVQVGADGIN